MIKLIDLYEEVVNGRLFLYHRTKISILKNLTISNFKLIPNRGRTGIGTYFVYDSPLEIASGMDTYGGVSLKYSIPISSLNNFLIFDSELQSKSLEEQLSPITPQINKILNKRIEDGRLAITNRLDQFLLNILKNPSYRNNLLSSLIDLYKQNKLNQLRFLEIINEENILENYFDGILYSSKGNSSSIKTPGTDKTAIVFNQSLLKFEGISTDGVNYTLPDEKKSIMSPEVSLKKNLIPPNTTIKKSFISIKNAKNVTIPPGLKVIGSLDLRQIPNLVIPDDLEVTNSLYVSPGINVPSSVKAGRIVVDS
jgi:hypothetical protein